LISGGASQAQFEPQRMLHLRHRQIEQLGDDLRGLARSELLRDNLGGYRPYYRAAVLMQRVEGDGPPRTSSERLPWPARSSRTSM